MSSKTWLPLGLTTIILLSVGLVPADGKFFCPNEGSQALLVSEGTDVALSRDSVCMASPSGNGFDYRDGDEDDSISAIVLPTADQQPSAIFSLDGRKLQSLSHGVHIVKVNGKSFKVYVK